MSLLKSLLSGFILFIFVGLQIANANVDNQLAACVETPDDAPSLAAPSSIEEYAQSIATYLSAGGDPLTLRQALLERGLVPNFYPDNVRLSTQGVYVADLTGESLQDVAVNLFFPEGDGSSGMGTFVIWIYVCEQGAYQLVHQDVRGRASPVLDWGTYISSLMDLTGDGIAEVLFNSGSCGMFCFMGVTVLKWDAESRSFQRVFDDSYSIGTLGNYSVVDPDGDGTYEIIIFHDAAGPAGAGVLRDYTITFSWNGQQFVETNSVVELPRYDFEFLHDANSNLMAGQPYTALALYEVATNSLDPATVAAANFGILVATTAIDGVEAASDEYATLLTSPMVTGRFGVSDFQPLWIEFGRVFYETVQATGSISAACDAVISEINVTLAEVDNVVRQYGYWSYEGASAAPQPEEVCPF